MGNQSETISWPSVLADILQRHTGRGQQVTVEEIAEQAGTTAKVVYLVRQDKYTPSFDMAMRIVKALPEEAGAEFLAHLGFQNPRRIDGVPGCFRKAHATIAKVGAVMAHYFEDDRLDHREEAELRRKHFPMLQAVIARCMKPRVGA